MYAIRSYYGLAGVVDVPGHERFIHNMLAGVGGMDLVLLVIDVMEGVMPQTREHLQILELLGIQRGVVVVITSYSIHYTKLYDRKGLERAGNCSW